jgi:hypothetical protein
LNQWIADATAPVNLYDPYGYETGPGFLLPDGRAFFMGSLGNTAFYTPSGNNSPGTWSTGPNLPNNLGAPDVAGAMMLNGKIIFSAGPKPTSQPTLFVDPTYYYEFDYLNNSFTQVSAPGGGLTLADTAFNSTMLNLPDGSIMLSRQYHKTYYVYQPSGFPLAAGKPTISTVAQNPCSNTCTLTGLLFNGICEGACYGDDWQMGTNFPIVRLTAGSNVYYARSFNWNRVGVKTGSLADTTLFEIPPGLPNGTYSLCVIANGNASDPLTFTFAPFPALTSPLIAPDICSGSNFTYNPVSNMSNTTLQWTRAAVPGISNAAITAPQTSNPNEILTNTSSISRTAVYAYTLTNGSCITHYLVSVVVHPVSTLSVSANTYICDNVSQVLTASGLSTYSWSTGATTNTISINPLSTTVYSVTGFSPYGCPASQQLTITVKPSPAVSIVGPTLVCMGDEVTFSAPQVSGINYNWNVGQSGNTITVTPSVNTTYSVVITATNGCHGYAAITVSVQNCDGITELNKNNFLSVYPNPAQDKLYIESHFAQNETVMVYMYDTFGRIIKTETLHTKAGDISSIDISNLSEGMYMMVLQKRSGSMKVKVIKE